MGDVEERLKELKDAGEVRRFLDELCEPWGGVRRLDVFTDKRGDLLCFVELNEPENKTRFYSIIRGTSYGDSFVFKIPARKGAAGT